MKSEKLEVKSGGEVRQRIGILGGSFDPVHNGHLRIAKSFLDSGLIEKLLVIPAPSPPHKHDLRVSFQHRFTMLQLAFQNWDRVEVSDLEKKLPAPSYSIQTIQNLQHEYPESIFYLCLGEDSLIHFHTWHRYRDIIGRVTLLVAERPRFESSLIEKELLEKTIFVDHIPVDLSSTEIRESSDNPKESNRIPGSVQEYIQSHNLYV